MTERCAFCGHGKRPLPPCDGCGVVLPLCGCLLAVRRAAYLARRGACTYCNGLEDRPRKRRAA